MKASLFCTGGQIALHLANERPEAVAFIAREFFERRDLFLVSRDSGVTFP